MPRGDGTWGGNTATGKSYERLITYDEETLDDKAKGILDQLKAFSKLEGSDPQFATFEKMKKNPEGYTGTTPVIRIAMPKPNYNTQHHVQWRLWRLRKDGHIQDLRLDNMVPEPEKEDEPEAEPEKPKKKNAKKE